MPLDVSQAAGLLISPLTGHLVEEVPANPAVELVDIHGVNAGLEPVVLGTKSLDRFFVCQSASKFDPLSACNIDPLSGTAEVVPVVNRGDPCGFV